MDTEKCRALLCILKHGSLTAAADELGYTTSGISRMLSSFEKDLGVVLLIRSRTGIIPTDACKSLLPVIREISYLSEQCTQISNQLRGLETGEIRIGTSYRSYYPWLIELITDFIRSYPGIKVHIQEGVSSELIDELMQHRLDICIISQREGEHTWLPLQDYPIVAWLPPDHKYTDHTSVPLSAYETEPYIDTYPGQDTDNARIFRRHHITPNTCFSTTDIYASYKMVEAGLGISMNNSLNADGWNGQVIIRPLDPPQTATIGLAISSLDLLSPAAKKFVSYIQQKFNK